MWENSDRFCNTAGSTGTGQFPKAGVGTLTTCVPPAIATLPYYDDCRWKTQNVSVHDNDFRIDKVALSCQGTQCGQQGLFSKPVASPSWSPYPSSSIQDAITFRQNNRFDNNRYVGDWRFDVYGIGNVVGWDTWRAAPYNQDTGSSLMPSAPPPPAQVNVLDADTSGLEGSIGKWVPWFSAGVSRSSRQSHSGANSLKVDINARYGWGVTMSNWPGFAATPGNKTIGFWAEESLSSSLGVTMQVKWRDAAGNDLKTDVVTLSNLTTSWQQATAVVAAPAGTARVHVELLSGSGGPGDTVYLDDVAVTDSASAPPPPSSSGLLDSDTQGLEGSLGKWAPWFSAAVSRSNLEAHSGMNSLKVDIAARFGWGVTTSNWPGFAATPGSKTIGFWAKTGSGDTLAASMQVKWRDAAGNDLRADVVTISALTSGWQQASATVVAPPGTANVQVEMLNSSGVPGDTVYLDDFLVAP